jgi:hypothetical protein
MIVLDDPANPFFAHHCEAEAGSKQSETFKLMERKANAISSCLAVSFNPRAKAGGDAAFSQHPDAIRLQNSPIPNRSADSDKLKINVRDFFRTFVNQENDQITLRMIGRDRMRDVLHQHGFTGARRRHYQRALALADWRDDVDNPCRKVLSGGVFDPEDPERSLGSGARFLGAQIAVTNEPVSHDIEAILPWLADL